MLVVLLAAAPAAHAAPARPVAEPADDPGDEAGDEPGLEGEDAAGTLAVDAAGERSPAGGELGLIDELDRELAAMRSSTYSHTTRVREAEGAFDLDCSGLVDYALARAAPRALGELRAATVKRPLAKHYVAWLRSRAVARGQGAWRAVARATELAPGDVIAWLRPADVTSRNTGHVMVVRGAVERDPDHADTLIVPVIDSTAVPHGRGDSRKAARATGLGTGEILLVVDARGAPIAYRWSRGTRARRHATTIALGRVAP